MKKITKNLTKSIWKSGLIALTFLFSLTINAQWVDDFEDGDVTDWTLVQAGDTSTGWVLDNGTMSHADDNVSTGVDNYLVSPLLDLTGLTAPLFSYDETGTYQSYYDYHGVLTSTDFDGANAATATWTEIAAGAAPTSLTTSEFTLGTDVTGVAFRYQGDWADTWVVDNVSVIETPAVPVTIPWIDDFEDGDVTDWTLVQAGDTSTGWVLDNGTMSHADDNVSTGVDNYLVSPLLDLTGLTAPLFSYDETGTYQSYYDYHGVLTSTDFDGANAATATWTEIAAGAAPTSLTTSEFTLGTDVTGVAFRYQGDWADTWVVDNVSVVETPTAAAMEASVSVTGADATISISTDNFTIGSGDGDGHWHYSLNSGDTVMVYSADDLVLSGLPNGDHSIYIWLVDNAHAALDPVAEQTIAFSTFDGTAACDETVTYTQVANGNYTVALTAAEGQVASVTINAVMETNWDHIYVYDGAGTLLNTTQDDGTFTDVVYTSTDATISVNVTNDGSVQNGDVTLAFACVDVAAVAMEVSVSVTGADATISISTDNFTIGSGDGDGHWHYSLNSGDTVMVYSADDLVLSGLPNGDHSIYIGLVDNAHAALDPAVEQTIAFSTFDGTAACGDTFSVCYDSDTGGLYTDEAPLSLFSATAEDDDIVSVTFEGSVEEGYDYVIVTNGAGALLTEALLTGDLSGVVVVSDDGTINVGLNADTSWSCVSGQSGSDSLDISVACYGLSVSNLDDELDMRIYPNPSNGSYVTMQTPANGVKYVEVFDITGKRLMNTTLSADTLDVSSISSGMYLVKVTIEGQSKTSKLIIR